ncbi:MAG: nucleotide exchange factor GrpE [Chloroflexi bacterium]|nr:nucleotide exchange factor GrpE [Chloroflexota bacterium]
MTDKKKHKHEEEVKETPSDHEAQPQAAEIEALTKRVEEAEARAAEYKDGWLRSQAEFVNYKNRVARDNELTYFSMKSEILKKVLPVLDDLERALPNRVAGDAWADGIELIVRKFQTALEKDGVIRIEAEGRPFDPNFHEAISHEPNPDVESGHVIAVVQNGYMFGERVIRPALVRVAQ